MGCSVANSFSIRFNYFKVLLCRGFIGDANAEANQDYCVIPKMGEVKMGNQLIALPCSYLTLQQSNWEFDPIFGIVRSTEEKKEKLVWGLKYHELFPDGAMSIQVPYLTLVSIDSQYVLRF